MREKIITIKVTDEDLQKAGFATSELSDLDFEKVTDSIGIRLKIAVPNCAIEANNDFWWLPRNEKE